MPRHTPRLALDAQKTFAQLYSGSRFTVWPQRCSCRGTRLPSHRDCRVGAGHAPATAPQCEPCKNTDFAVLGSLSAGITERCSVAARCRALLMPALCKIQNVNTIALRTKALLNTTQRRPFMRIPILKILSIYGRMGNALLPQFQHQRRSL